MEMELYKQCMWSKEDERQNNSLLNPNQPSQKEKGNLKTSDCKKKMSDFEKKLWFHQNLTNNMSFESDYSS